MTPNPNQPRDVNSLLRQQQQAASSILPERLQKKLEHLFKNGDRMTRLYIIGCLLVLMSSFVSPPHLSYESRRQSFTDIGIDSELWARNGFCSDGSGGGTCFHCGTRAADQRQAQAQAHRHTAGDPVLSRSNQGPDPAVCAFQQLLRLLGFRQGEQLTPAEIRAGANRSAMLINNLQAALRHPIVQTAMSFGFSEDDAALVLLRQGYVTAERSGIGQLRPGDLIGLIHDQNELLSADRLPWSISALVELAVQDQRRQVKDNAPSPMETRGDEVGSTQGQRRPPDANRRPVAKPQPGRPSPTTAQPHPVAAELQGQRGQQPVDTPPSTDSRMCIVCQRRVRNRVLLKCSHLVACDVCLQNRTRCPSCGESVLAAIPAFIP